MLDQKRKDMRLEMICFRFSRSVHTKKNEQYRHGKVMEQDSKTSISHQLPPRELLGGLLENI
jgi:hypothetical protein